MGVNSTQFLMKKLHGSEIICPAYGLHMKGLTNPIQATFYRSFLKHIIILHAIFSKTKACPTK